MSYSNSQPPRRTAPVIQRPSASSTSNSSTPYAATAAAIANAYSGSAGAGHYNPAFIAGHYQAPAYPYGQGYYPPPPPHHQPQLPFAAAAPYPYPHALPAPYTQQPYSSHGYNAAYGQQQPAHYPLAASAPGPGPSQLPAVSRGPHGLPARPSTSTASFSEAAHHSHTHTPQQQQQSQKRPRTLDSKAAAATGSHSTLPLPYDINSLQPPPLPSSSISTSGPPPRSQPRKERGRQGPEIIKCCKEDCTFSGPRRLVREHEEDRHLVFAPGREPKPWSGSLKPIDGSVIEGTGISLDTPEALARWIEERKKRWPSKKVVEEKEKARAERIAAGLEAPPRERGSGRGRGRGRGGAVADRDRGGARGAYGREEHREAGTTAAGEGAEGEPAAKRVKIEEEGAADLKRSIEGEDAGTSAREDAGSDADAEGDDDDDDDDGAPEEMAAKPARVADLPADNNNTADSLSVTKEGEQGALSNEPAPPSTNAGEDGGADPETAAQKRFQVVCRHWRKGNCALGEVECPYLHHLPPNAGPPPPPKRRRPAPAPAPHNPFARPAGFSDPFSLVEERDYRHIVADVLQVIEFLGANDWLQGVEIRRGQVEEESGIEVLQESGPGSEKEKVVEKEVEASEADQEMETDAGAEAPSKPLIVELSAVAPDLSAPTHQGAASYEPQQIQPQPPLTTDAASNPPKSGTASAGLFADYGSDSDDDEAVEQAVASALMAGA
ncbi:hypothetical protein JCM10908_004004 [Rhodotorula pacifica]|uniref:uncharacterized protein n=1 Tax=Rhodotorula pacifica TaxID=1495444 RepID=UPI0031782F28